MKRMLTLVACALFGAGAFAQTLFVTQGSVKYAFTAAQAGTMTYTDGTSLTIQGKTFTLADIDQMSVEDTTVTDNTISVAYDGTAATVVIAGNVAQYMTASVSGADVSLVQSSDLADEITYTLAGTSTDGSFYMDGELKASIVLNGLTLTNADGAAIQIDNGKRISIEVADGTTNTLVDGADGSQKACFFVNGHAEFKGGGTLNLTGNTKHAYRSDEYTELKSSAGTFVVTSAVTDGFHVGQYFEMKGGTITMSGLGGDGIQVEATSDSTDEYNGQMILTAGTINLTITGTAAKGLKCDSAMTVTDGTYTIATSGGGEYDSDEGDTNACSAIKAGGDLTINGGTFTLSATGAGGKGISGDAQIIINGGTITAKTTGSTYTYGSLDSDPKGIKSDGNMQITGGSVSVTSANSEGIESKGTLVISGGQVESDCYDDAINSAGNLTISGGYVYARATNNDGIDANGNLTISGGTVVAIGASAPETAIDAAEGYNLYINGGTIAAIGGTALTPASSSTQAGVFISSSLTAGSYVALYSGSTALMSYLIPTASSSSSTGGGPGGGSSSSRPLYLSCSSLTSGSSYTLKTGVTVSGGSDWHGLNTTATISGGSSSSTLTAATGSSSSGGGTNPGGGFGGR